MYRPPSREPKLVLTFHKITLPMILGAMYAMAIRMRWRGNNVPRIL
jgi:hypothetical protein